MNLTDNHHKPLVIPPEIYQNLPPLYKGVARLLEQEGKVRIIQDTSEPKKAGVESGV